MMSCNLRGSGYPAQKVMVWLPVETQECNELTVTKGAVRNLTEPYYSVGMWHYLDSLPSFADSVVLSLYKKRIYHPTTDVAG